MSDYAILILFPVLSYGYGGHSIFDGGIPWRGHLPESRAHARRVIHTSCLIADHHHSFKRVHFLSCVYHKQCS